MSAAISRKWYIIWGVLVLIIIAAAARIYLGIWLPQYVNRVLNSIEGYEGSIESLDIDLYRGAYRIHTLKLFKKNGHIPTPFLDLQTVDFSIQWEALLHGRIVSNADIEHPVINFAINRTGTAEQTGAGIDWTKPIKDLMPIDINLVTFREGKLTYQDFSTNPQVNIYIHHMTGEARNLRNVVDREHALPSTLEVSGDSIGGGKLAMNGRLNILKQVPDMDMKTKLEKVDLHALSDYSNAYAAVDIERGTLNVYSELIVKDNVVSGYVKPIATDVSLIDLRKSANPIKLAWEVVVATVVEIFTNQPRDQFATKIPLEGHLDNIDTAVLPALGGIIRNAFIESFKKGFDRSITP